MTELFGNVKARKANTGYESTLRLKSYENKIQHVILD